MNKYIIKIKNPNTEEWTVVSNFADVKKGSIFTFLVDSEKDGQYCIEFNGSNILKAKSDFIKTNNTLELKDPSLIIRISDSEKWGIEVDIK